jgi:hypothetical protein
MISLEWGALGIRLGALVLRLTLVFWFAASVIIACTFGYVLLSGGEAFRTFLMLLQCVVPGVVTWFLAGYFWRHAENLVTPPEFHSQEWNDEPQGGRELLTAALVLVGAYFLVTGVFELIASWRFYELFRESGDWFLPDSGDGYAAAEGLRLAAIAVVQILIASLLTFAGRHLAARLSR